MKKTIIIFSAIFKYFRVVIDRLAMAPFAGVDLPSPKNKDLLVDENTTDEQIEQSVIDDDNHEIMYRDVYLPRARKRSRNVIIALISWYLFTILSWNILLITTAAIAVSIGIGILVMYIKRKSNKVEDGEIEEHKV